jgi:predicted RNA-binding protein Jag
MVNESAYQEFTGKSVEEALKGACEAFKVGIGDLDFEIIAPGSRGVLGMGAEPARIVAAPVSALGGTAPKRTGGDSGRAASASSSSCRPRDACAGTAPGSTRASSTACARTAPRTRAARTARTA